MKIKARIIEILPDNKYVAVDESSISYTAILKGNMKKKKIYVGDFINISKSDDVYVIEELMERDNYFIRPPVANIDYMILCISLDKPCPDYNLLDKQIVLCKSKNINIIICVTKMDLLNEENNKEYEYINNIYGNLGFKIIYTSSINDKNIQDKFEFENGKVYAFSGNSGVGKSSITSKLIV